MRPDLLELLRCPSCGSASDLELDAIALNERETREGLLRCRACRLASATFARSGLRTVALDISMVEMQGLRTADWWFEAQGNHFERVLAQMSALPFADDSLDWVFCCEVLHHNDRPGMIRALREIHRVLRPGGSLLVMNEPLRRPTDLKRDHGAEVAHFDGNEHVHQGSAVIDSVASPTAIPRPSERS